ncbi:class I SAM-dependent methyltransferase [Paenibacillus albiflavus]|uniref:Class I SAM-dependent methyltransferase n=1 Tax=Paenibacillus albiflavus TaxID=2545760 RepID=A0A4R4ELS5_9BACL|nr:class I SAM-dependent methyltransferase [Paenibacillus albiflavus]TCZ79268.1 class I SAM-dependent methyltransferase [Paenibacillus albiflavus]
MEVFELARRQEISYHEKLYTEHKLFESGTWLAKPVKVVVETFDLLDAGSKNVLDLGCGVGRNSIPIAQKLQAQGGNIYCVDLLQTAIEVLNQNAQKYDVQDLIVPIVADAEHYKIPELTFDYIISCSCLEHVSSESAFETVVRRLQAGTRAKGFNCILMSTEVMEQDLVTGEETAGVIELNLNTQHAIRLLQELYQDWEILIMRHLPQEMTEIKYGRNIKFKSNWLTFVANKS